MRNRFEHTAPKLFNLGWSHGRFADFWSLVHFLTGLIFGILAPLLGLAALPALIAVIVGSVVYEGLEMLAGVVEDFENSLFDVVIAGAGAAIALYGFGAVSLSHQALLLIFAIIANLWLIHKGWHNYLKRKAAEGRNRNYLFMALWGATILGGICILLIVAYWLP